MATAVFWSRCRGSMIGTSAPRRAERLPSGNLPLDRWRLTIGHRRAIRPNKGPARRDQVMGAPFPSGRIALKDRPPRAFDPHGQAHRIGIRHWLLCLIGQFHRARPHHPQAPFNGQGLRTTSPRKAYGDRRMWADKATHQQIIPPVARHAGHQINGDLRDFSREKPRILVGGHRSLRRLSAVGRIVHCGLFSATKRSGGMRACATILHKRP